MTPDTYAALSGDLSDAAAFLHAFAAAPDWQDCVDTLWMTLPHVLPGIRVDVYAAGPADLASLLFSSVERPLIAPALGSVSDTQIRGWLEREGYTAIMTLPLIGAGRRQRWHNERPFGRRKEQTRKISRPGSVDIYTNARQHMR